VQKSKRRGLFFLFDGGAFIEFTFVFFKVYLFQSKSGHVFEPGAQNGLCHKVVK
jgi:hypothetical protein